MTALDSCINLKEKYKMDISFSPNISNLVFPNQTWRDVKLQLTAFIRMFYLCITDRAALWSALLVPKQKDGLDLG